MADEEQIAILMDGPEAWNAWRRRRENFDTNLDLSGANLRKANLHQANLSGDGISKAILNRADLSGADLSRAGLSGAYLSRANLTKANLLRAELVEADLRGANLTEANLLRANLRWADLSGADLSGANLLRANLSGADLSGANLKGANLEEVLFLRTNLEGASLEKANLCGADLQGVLLVGTRLANANLTGCRVYGMSAWDLSLEGATQKDLIITRWDQPQITVDNLEVAQFIYLLLNNERIRHVIDTITSKVVLILGRFSEERKPVLDALREELRQRDYLPVLFDFDVPANRDITETVSLLARMARFIVADLTDPSSLPKELEAIVPDLAVPVQPLLEIESRPYAMFKDYWKYDWVLPIHRYEGLESLLASMVEKVIAPAEAKARALEERRRTIEAGLTRPAE
jgi:uncharacterized protein YjbI with pentapeptide repeats